MLSARQPITPIADDPGNELIFYSWGEKKHFAEQSGDQGPPQCGSSRSIIPPPVLVFFSHWDKPKSNSGFVEFSWSTNAGFDGCSRPLILYLQFLSQRWSVDKERHINHTFKGGRWEKGGCIWAAAICSPLTGKGWAEIFWKRDPLSRHDCEHDTKKLFFCK